MFPKTLLAVTLAVASFTSYAANYYVVVPFVGKSVNADAIGVELLAASLPGGTVGLLYRYDFNQVLRVTGDPSYTGSGGAWSVHQGSLPAGLTLDAQNGVLTGVPTTEGTSSFTLNVLYKTKQGTQSYQIPVSMNIDVTLAPGTLPGGAVGTPYSYDLKQRLTVTGDSQYNVTNVSWAVTSGSLPNGLTLSPAGLISGTPSTAGTSNFTVEATYKGKPGSTAYALTFTVYNNYAAAQAGATIGASKPNVGSTTDAYFGPNGYNLTMATGGAWSAMGALESDSASLTSRARPVKLSYTGSTFRGQGSAAAPFQMVIDLGQVRTFNSARYYQMFSDGKTTHAALDVSSSGNLEVRTSPNWTQVHGFAALDNSSTSEGVGVPFAPATARYLRLRLYNNGIYGFTNYTELYSFKLFNE